MTKKPITLGITLLGFLLAAGAARADGAIEVSVAETIFQSAFASLSKAGKLPTSFGEDRPDSNMFLRCRAPIVRLPSREIDGDDLAPRVVVHLVCALKSPRFAFEFGCPYLQTPEVPLAELRPDGERQCPHVQVSLTPTIEAVAPGVKRPALTSLKVERFALVPPGFDRELSQKFRMLEGPLLEKLNANFRMLENPWFRSLMPVPVDLRPLSFTVDMGTGGVSKRSGELSIDRMWLDLEARRMRLRLLYKSMGGS
jgi:hypothetical protein